MRHCARVSGAVLVLAGGLWQSAGPAAAQPAAAAHGPSETSARASQWSRADVDAARARCTVLLKGLSLVAIPAEPVLEGDCGAPAPVQLISIGAAPQVALSPPPLVTCEMAAALAGWIETEVQPAARAALGGAVIRLEVMSAYSCRNAYARLKARLSEHGRANALDVAMFVTERGEVAHLHSDWGDPERDVQTRMAAAKTGKEPAAPADGTRNTVTLAADTAIRRAGNPSAGLGAATPALSLTPPSRLGGPRPPRVAEAPPRQRFLRRIHAAACRHFGTVLGPEANEAHRNHFHLDMAERKARRICE